MSHISLDDHCEGGNMVFRMCTLQTCLMRHAKKASSHSSGTSPTKNNDNSLIIIHKSRAILCKHRYYTSIYRRNSGFKDNSAHKHKGNPAGSVYVCF